MNYIYLPRHAIEYGLYPITWLFSPLFVTRKIDALESGFDPSILRLKRLKWFQRLKRLNG